MPRTIMLKGPEYEQFQEKLKTCQICGFHDEKPVWKHAWLKHGISKQDYSLKYLVHDCPCGCGKKVKPHKNGCISFYIKGHLGPNQKWPESDELLLRFAYKTWPPEIPSELLAKYSRGQCLEKAHRLGLTPYENRQTRVKKLSSIKAAYIAGILDSDGYMSFRVNNEWRKDFTASNTDKRVLEWLLDTIGAGQIVANEKGSEIRKPSWRFEITRQVDNYHLLIQVRDYVHGRRERVDETIEVLEKRYGKESS